LSGEVEAECRKAQTMKFRLEARQLLCNRINVIQRDIGGN
jgi:hypothetical protein